MTNRTPYSKLECCAQGVILHRGHRMSDVIGIVGIIDSFAYRLYRRRGGFPCLGKHAGIGRKATGRCRQDCVHTCPDALPVSQPFPRNGLPAKRLITAICHQVSCPCSDKDRSECSSAQDTPCDNGTHCYNFTTNFNPLQPALVVCSSHNASSTGQNWNEKPNGVKRKIAPLMSKWSVFFILFPFLPFSLLSYLCPCGVPRHRRSTCGCC